MKKSYLRTLALVGGLLILTCGAMGYSARNDQMSRPPGFKPPDAPAGAAGKVSLSGRLVQDKLHMGGDGIVTLALTLASDDASGKEIESRKPLDMVVVLDRSSSMNEAGKITYARQAVLGLLSQLSDADRFALVSYSDQAQRHGGLFPLTPSNRATLEKIVHGIQPGGFTNLSGGLQEGMSQLTESGMSGRASRLILISDGQANRGVTDPSALGKMASTAADKGFVVSTVGVGLDFNERLMSAIADKGTGNYYFMESAEAFAQVLDKELKDTRTVVASAVQVHVPLPPGAELINAAGYPIEVKDGKAIFRPGDLLSGRSRKIFLTMRIPANEEKTLDIGAVSAHYRHGEQAYTATTVEPLRVACVRSRSDAMASIDKEQWEQKVIQEDYNRLRDEVAAAVKDGKREEAMTKINSYVAGQALANETVGSAAIAGNLDKDVGQLRQTVEDSFTGSPAEAAMKQKANSKNLQYDGYQKRRAKF